MQIITFTCKVISCMTKMYMIDLFHNAITYFTKKSKNLRAQGCNTSSEIFALISVEAKQGLKDTKRTLTLIYITGSQETWTPPSVWNFASWKYTNLICIEHGELCCHISPGRCELLLFKDRTQQVKYKPYFGLLSKNLISIFPC